MHSRNRRPQDHTSRGHAEALPAIEPLSSHTQLMPSVQHLQRTVGNRAVSRLLQKSPSPAALQSLSAAPSGAVIQRLFLTEANRHINDDQDTYKAEYNLAKTAGRQTDLAAIMQAQSATAVKPDAIMLAAPLKRLEQVSLPSPAHWEHEVGNKFRSIAKHVYGWSFGDMSMQQRDVDLINDFVTKYEAGTDVTGHAVTFKLNLPKVEYTVNDRTYSTHADHNQLYPISGTDITNGIGPVMLGNAMKDLGILTDERRIKLYQIYCELGGIDCNHSGIGSLSNKQKTEYLEAFQKLMG
jgi:hypothetical protein